MFPSFIILSRKNAEYALSFSKDTDTFKGVVSIGDIGESSPDNLEKIPNVLRLEFTDTYDDKDQEAPQKEHIEKLIVFADKMKDFVSPETIMFHCYAGISRSSASAYISNFIWRKNEKEALDAVYKGKEDTCPNALMVKIADSILGSSLLKTLKKKPCGDKFYYPNLMNGHGVWK